jgi:exoribonuclease R
MLALSKHNWLSGTLELTSKVRYGLSSRGVPIFRFIPYDKRLPPLAVGCSQRSLFYNVHAVVEPSPEPPATATELQKGTLIQNLGKPSLVTEAQVLLHTYAHDSRKDLRKFPPVELEEEHPSPLRKTLQGYTFHIDPPGCRDVDDSITMFWNTSYWEVAINIADVAETVKAGSTLDTHAQALATSFYTPEGQVAQSMLPPELSEAALSLLPGGPKDTVSLLFDFYPQQAASRAIKNIRWALTTTQTTTSYTYSQADQASCQELLTLSDIAEALGAPPNSSSHEWIQALMIFYNKQAGETLASNPSAILRRHAEGKQDRVAAILSLAGVPEHLAFESAEYCLATDPNTFHFGLAAAKYAYATSPIRRYADLINQRAIKAILLGQSQPPLTQELIDDLNRREKQAKAFSRDYFFMTALAQTPSSDLVRGVVMESKPEGGKTRVWVQSWKRVITVKHFEPQAFTPGSIVAIQWYDNKEKPRWKERMVFHLEKTDL